MSWMGRRGMGDVGMGAGSKDGGGSSAEINGELGKGGDGCNKAGGRICLDCLLSGGGYRQDSVVSFSGTIVRFMWELI